MRTFGRRTAMCVALVVLAAAAVGGYALSAGGRAQALACGAIVTTSIKLTADLEGCTGHGLIVQASNVKIDLDGHTINGDDGATDLGIMNTGGFDKVTVKNGTITDFGTAVKLDGGADANTITGLTIRSTSGASIVLAAAPSTKVSDNAVLSSGGDAIQLNGTLNSTIDGNRIVLAAGVGIPVVGNGNTIKSNLLSGTGGEGITIDGDGNKVDSNTVRRSLSEGLVVGGDGTTITKNVIEISDGEGIQLDGASDTVVSGNRVLGSDFNGILVINGSANVQILKNSLLGNEASGIEVIDGSALVVSGNTASTNAEQGLLICDSDTTLSKNTADANGGHGIFRDPGSVDGGNTAADNATDPQILVAFCV